MSYRYDVHGIGDTRWSNNAMEYMTAERAERAAVDLSMRWTGFDAYRIVPADHPKREAYDVAASAYTVHLL